MIWRRRSPQAELAVAKPPAVPSAYLMVRPPEFCGDSNTSPEIALARQQFGNLAAKLVDHGIDLVVAESNTPGEVFTPNTHTSYHPDGTVVRYPTGDSITGDLPPEITDQFAVSNVIDLRMADEPLDGARSLVFDHANKIAFACKSERTSPRLAEYLCGKLGYELVLFASQDGDTHHTADLLSLGHGNATICSESINGRDVLGSVLDTGRKDIIYITLQQSQRLASKSQLVYSADGPRTVMSTDTESALGEWDKIYLNRHGRRNGVIPHDGPQLPPDTVITADLSAYRGMGASDLIAPVHLPRK